jgi:chromosome segregation ATPase
VSVSDLIPGEPAVVRQTARELESVASEAADAVAALGGAIRQYGVGEPGGWRGAGATEARDRFQALAAGLRQLSGALGDAGRIVQRFAADLERAQTAARELQRQERQATEELHQVQRAMRQVEGALRQASTPAAALALEQRFNELAQEERRMEVQIARVRQNLETLQSDWHEAGAAYAARIATVGAPSATQLI